MPATIDAPASGRDLFEEDPSFGGADLDVEVAQEVHTEDTVDAVVNAIRDAEARRAADDDAREPEPSSAGT